MANLFRACKCFDNLMIPIKHTMKRINLTISEKFSIRTVKSKKQNNKNPIIFNQKAGRTNSLRAKINGEMS
jgi:hypothetical protein